MNMLKTVAKTIREYSMVQDGDKVLCALSGGADSVSLLLCLHELGVPVCACHLNHCLRGEQSDGDEEFCKRLCAERGISFVSERIDAAKAAEETGESLETAARELRYDFFDRSAEKLGATKIATAHNAEDNLETMLFRLIRGTGTTGLAGIPPVRGRIIRPLLFIERRDIEIYLNEKGIVWRTDHTNNEDFCTRNRIRHQVIPALKAINPAAARQAANAAVLLRQDEQALDDIAKSRPEPCTAEWINSQPEAVASRAIRLELAQAGVPEGETTRKHIAAVRRLCLAGSGSASLPGRKTAELRNGVLTVQSMRQAEEVVLEPEQPAEFGEYMVCLTRNSDNLMTSIHTEAFSCGIIKKEHMAVRSWRSGDRMKLPGSRGMRTLKRLYAERGITPAQRSGLPVLCSGDEIIAAAGIGAAEKTETENDNASGWLWTVWRKERITYEHG